MYKYLILLGILFWGFESFAVDCKAHRVYCHIKQIAPELSNSYTMQVSNAIYLAAKKYKVPAKILTAIYMQESRFKLNAKNCTKGLTEGSDSIVMVVCSDFGLSQIHINTIKAYGFDVKRLTTDLNYSAEAGAKVLSHFHKRFGQKEPNWWVRYNTGYLSRKKYRRAFEKYEKDVSRWLNYQPE